MSLVPTIYELPCMQFGGAPVYLLADLDEGARVSWSAPGKLEVLHSCTLPAGMMLVVVGPDHARNFRPLKVRKSPNPLELAQSPFVSIGPVEIPVLVDVEFDLDATITRGMLVGGERIAVPVVPALSIVAAIPPELAQKIRPVVQRAMAEARKMAQAGQRGAVLH